MTRPDSWIERTEVFDAYNESPYRRPTRSRKRNPAALKASRFRLLPLARPDRLLHFACGCATEGQLLLCMPRETDRLQSWACHEAHTVERGPAGVRQDAGGDGDAGAPAGLQPYIYGCEKFVPTGHPPPAHKRTVECLHGCRLDGYRQAARRSPAHARDEISCKSSE